MEKRANQRQLLPLRCLYNAEARGGVVREGVCSGHVTQFAKPFEQCGGQFWPTGRSCCKPSPHVRAGATDDVVSFRDHGADVGRLSQTVAQRLQIGFDLLLTSSAPPPRHRLIDHGPNLPPPRRRLDKMTHGERQVMARRHIADSHRVAYIATRVSAK